MSFGAALGIDRLVPVRDVAFRFGGLVGYDHLLQDAVSGTTRHTPAFSYHATLGLDVPAGPVELRLQGGAGGQVFTLRSEGVVHRLAVFGMVSLGLRWDL